jgi:hypothetical protein
VTQKLPARYECYPDSRVIAEYLALQLERADDIESGSALRKLGGFQLHRLRVSLGERRRGQGIAI